MIASRGRPSRTKTLEEFIVHAQKNPGVVFMRKDEIVRSQVGTRVASSLELGRVRDLPLLVRYTTVRQPRKGERWRMGKKKVADLLVDVPAEAGVRRIYGVSGDSLNGIMDSIRAKKQFQWIHVRRGEVAAMGKLKTCLSETFVTYMSLLVGT
jgi:hypothetical protein